MVTACNSIAKLNNNINEYFFMIDISIYIIIRKHKRLFRHYNRTKHECLIKSIYLEILNTLN